MELLIENRNKQYVELFNHEIKTNDNGKFIEQLLINYFSYLEEIKFDIKTDINIDSNIFECISLYAFTTHYIQLCNDDITIISPNHFIITIPTKNYFKHKNNNGFPIVTNACTNTVIRLYYKKKYENVNIDSLQIYISGSTPKKNLCMFKLKQNLDNLTIA